MSNSILIPVLGRLVALAAILLTCTGAGSVDAPATAPSETGAEGGAGIADRLKACAACHGEEGHSRADTYYPSIAGKPAGYLYNQLVNFRDGRRHHTIMESMLAYLPDDYLHEIAGYYAAAAPALAPPIGNVPPAELELGAHLAEHGDTARNIPPCKACHGAALTGTAPAIPALLGLRTDYLVAQIGAWKAGVRHSAAPDCMATIAKALTSQEIAAVTAWLASTPYPTDFRPAHTPAGKLPLDCGVMQ